MVRYCNTCGAPIVNDQAHFCNKCGAPLVRSETEINEREVKSPPKVTRVEISKKYSHIPLVAGDSNERFSISNEKISFNTIGTLPKRDNAHKKRIQETRCTCLACGRTWYYGKSEVFSDLAAKTRNFGKNISACSCCCWPMSYMSREKTGIDKCPNCGSKAVKKEQITHEVE